MTERNPVIITGATSGIGRATARQLAARGYDLVLVCRNLTRGEAVVEELQHLAPAASVLLVRADLERPVEVRKAAEEIMARCDGVTALINNAGIHAFERRLTEDGIESMTAVNYFAPFVLTTSLLPLLGASGGARVITVASEAHRTGWKPDPDDIAGTRPNWGSAMSMRAYGRSKLLDILFTLELARRVEGDGITANCLCPGLVATELAREVPRAAAISKTLASTPLVRTPEQGARMSVRMVTDPRFGTETGRFETSTAPLRLLPARPVLRDTDLQRRIWESTERFLAGLGLETPEL